MKRIFLYAAMLLVMSQAACAQKGQTQAVAADPEAIMLTISGDPARSRAVSWRTGIADTLSYGEIVVLNPHPDMVEDAVRIEGTHSFWETGASDYKMGHKVVFNDLLPETKYAYRVGNGEQWSEWFQFETASDKAEPFSFLYFGDVQNDIKSLGSRALRQAYSHFPESKFMLFAGDLVNRSFREPWDEFFHTGGWIFGTIPSMPVAGNHEYYDEGDKRREFSLHWNQIYTMPDNAPESTVEDLTNRVYYFDYQGVRFVAVDSYRAQDSLYADAILKWLDEVLKSNPNKWAVVYMHHPIYSCSQGRGSEGQSPIKPILEKYGVDLVLQGHDHTYCRGFSLQGVTPGTVNPPMYVVSVAGPKMYGLNVSFWADRVASNTQLYQHICIDGDTLDFKTYDVTGSLYDSFKLVKQQGRANRFIEGDEIESVREKSQMLRGDGYTEEEVVKYTERLAEK